jgi:hypothetical protein
MKKRIWIITGVVLFSVSVCVAYFIYDKNSKENKILSMVGKNRDIVNYYCKVNHINPRVYISVVYGELHSNWNFFDDFDNIRAQYGFDPSAGFGQMRVSTFMWIEDKYADGTIITKSRTRDELVHKLLNDTTNIAYSSFYVKQISDKLLSLDGSAPTIRQIGSFYSIGIDHGERKMNKKNTTPVGREAENFYYSNNLIDIYPRE